MKILEEIKVIPGTPLEGENPLPSFRPRKPVVARKPDDFPPALMAGQSTHNRVLPYTVQDRYGRKRIPLKLQCLVLENDYLRAEFLPRYGGRLYSLFDKVAGEDLVMRNPVIQPGNLAIRNAWLSGGIEWNIGNIGHAPTTCDDVFAAVLRDDEGNDFLRIYEFERMKSLFWQVDFHLPDDSRELIVHVRMVNPFDRATTTYWWSNVAAQDDDGKTRVLCSGSRIISFLNGMMTYESLPEIQAMPSIDVTYPSRATRSFDFFIQPEDEDFCTWEASAYGSGVTLYERSTPPLSCKKLFTWGNHHAGRHWQEFLSEKGHGFYAEIQAGIAPSQLHERLLDARSAYEWTQCFGGIQGDYARLSDEDFRRACAYLGEKIEKRMSQEKLRATDSRCKKLATMALSEGQIRHTGSGFGALEAERMARQDDGTIPASMCFPAFTMGAAEAPYRHLLEKGVFPPESGRYFTPSYMISDRWLPLMEESLARPGGRTWHSLMQVGVAWYDGMDQTRYSNEAATDEDVAKREAEAEKAWLESIALEPTYLVYRNLANLERQRGDFARAERYYDLAIGCAGAFDDFALASEYLAFLKSRGEDEKLWDLYLSLPENCKTPDRVRITVASAAVKLDKLDYLERFFAEEHHDIREGECSLTDLWFEYCARRMARERGIAPITPEKLDRLIDEAWENCPPAPEIDFRMSFDRKSKYRI